MPIYEYQCQGCGHQFDIIQKVSDKKLTLCPKCNQQYVPKFTIYSEQENIYIQGKKG